MDSDEISQRRAALNLTQQQLADEIGVNRVTLARWELGTSSPRGLAVPALEATLSRLEKDQARRAAKRAAYAAAQTRQNEDGLQ